MCENMFGRNVRVFVGVHSVLGDHRTLWAVLDVPRSTASTYCTYYTFHPHKKVNNTKYSYTIDIHLENLTYVRTVTI